METSTLLLVRIRTIDSQEMVPLPRAASASIRQMIVECLRDPRRWFIHRDNFRFLHSIDLRDDELVRDLIEDLENTSCFTNPTPIRKNTSSSWDMMTASFSSTSSFPRITLILRG